MQMQELEMIDEIFQLMQHYRHLRPVQKSGLSIIEMLITDDPEWRDEVARKGGVGLICELARTWEGSPKMLGQVMTCMAYLAAEDYLEVMLCQHGALEYSASTMRAYPTNADLMTKTSLALLNLTVCEPHVEELIDKEEGRNGHPHRLAGHGRASEGRQPPHHALRRARQLLRHDRGSRVVGARRGLRAHRVGDAG
ncbi:unnamed protein product [Prorocentrum cordatum]|uniref:Protein HGH1 homolog n=1 Tax=Prorocentrum cordatum TaxID=2364126 RepID=A0ABN9UZW3_9DINO|nr:unnamed protein product [Polarella glacialis]